MENLRSLPRKTIWGLLVGLVLIGFAYLWQIDAPTLWGDEAGTAVFGKTILERGLPVGFDGRNLSVFDNCASVSQDLLSKKIPWVQDYVASLSMRLFGRTTAGVRLLFVIIGIGAFLPLYAVLKRESHHPAILTSLILLSPQVVLFQRNARYYSLVILLFFLLLWTFYRQFNSQKIRLALCLLLSLLFFFTHQLAAFSTMLSLVILAALKDRASLKVYIPAFLIGGVSWAVFYISLKGVPGTTPDNIQLLLHHPSQWFYSFLIGLKATVLDLDYVNALPLLAWALIFCLALSKKIRQTILEPLGSPVSLLIWINLGIQMVVNSALVGFETAHQYALLRYMPHLVAASVIPLLLILENLATQSVKGWARNKAWVVLMVSAAVLFPNVFTLSYWFEPLPGRSPAVSWWPPVYAEIVGDKPDPFKTLIETMAREAAHPEETVLAWPSYINEILIFYVGHQYLIIPSVLEDSPCERCITRKIGLRNYRKFKRMPKWVVFFMNPLQGIPPGYELTTIPFFRHSPDATRPEITRHDFSDGRKRPKGHIFVYKRL
jgi:hypothetical protein